MSQRFDVVIIGTGQVFSGTCASPPSADGQVDMRAVKVRKDAIVG